MPRAVSIARTDKVRPGMASRALLQGRPGRGRVRRAPREVSRHCAAWVGYETSSPGENRGPTASGGIAPYGRRIEGHGSLANRWSSALDVWCGARTLPHRCSPVSPCCVISSSPTITSLQLSTSLGIDIVVRGEHRPRRTHRSRSSSWLFLDRESRPARARRYRRSRPQTRAFSNNQRPVACSTAKWWLGALHLRRQLPPSAASSTR